MFQSLNFSWIVETSAGAFQTCSLKGSVLDSGSTAKEHVTPKPLEPMRVPKKKPCGPDWNCQYTRFRYSC